MRMEILARSETGASRVPDTLLAIPEGKTDRQKGTRAKKNGVSMDRLICRQGYGGKMSYGVYATTRRTVKAT